jgi:hypothetical protein
MTATHVLLALLAAAVLVFDSTDPLAGRVVFALLLLLVVPVATVTYRLHQVRRPANVLAALLLYEVYYAARAASLIRIIVARQPDTPTTDEQPAATEA